MDDTERAFHGQMIRVYEDAKRETGYNATRFLQMVSEQGGLATARQLLHSQNASDGFTALWERRRLDLAVKSVVLRPEFTDLFTEEELDLARNRLEAYGFSPPS